ncbi:MAG TPA: Uma2 family endonuclease [Gemmatimonadaceae bacterium]|nr:Uma2 family endonuclease [Gemmatimonadaceae bacterium]
MIMTVDEFLDASLPDGKAELVRGELRMTPTPAVFHGRAATNLVVLLSNYVRQHHLGMVFGDSVGYELTQFPHTVRVPDLSFIRADRLPPAGLDPRERVFRFAPDLAVEVLSPSETAPELEEKLHDYIGAGASLIWVADPARRTIMTIPVDAPVGWHSEGDVLDGGAVLPGFSCAVAEVFEGIARK